MRILFVAVLALLAAAQVVRQALVSDPASNPALRSAAWPTHPEVLFPSIMDRIGQRAVAGQPPDPGDVEQIYAAALRSPLAPEPFLVRGVAHQVEGQDPLAGHAFRKARLRDPRSVPSRYFLAAHYERIGNPRAGLEEISALLRLVPTSVEAVAPQLAAYARRPEARPAVRSLLRDHPELEPAILGTLAKDSRNAELILALAPQGEQSASPRTWQSGLVGSLVADGRYDKAQALWATFSGVPISILQQSPIFNAEFARTDAPAPFNWALTSTAAGVAEYAEGGGLHIVYYGREPATLAAQVIRLKPGRYRLASQLGAGGKGAGALSWKLVCLPGRKPLFELPLDSAGGRPFTVPADCKAQQIELIGAAGDLAESADVTVARLGLSGGGQ